MIKEQSKDRTTARFWVYITCPVRITLRKGQTLTHSHGGRTDEGYSWETNSWHFDGATVYAATATDARDCDGRITHDATATCPVDELDHGFVEQDLPFIAYPNWTPHKASQRDFSAEAMGY